MSESYVDFPVFGDNSDKVKPDDPKYAAGFVPGDVLPAEWLNWFLNVMSVGYNQLKSSAENFTPSSPNTLTNKTIAYADNTLTGVQPTLTAGTGIDITGSTISSTVQGHKFAGGGQETLVTEHMLNASNALQFTVPYDCILSIQSAKTNTGYSAVIYLNNVVTDVLFLGNTVSPQTFIDTIPVKANDVFRMTTDLPSTSPQTWRVRVSAIKYR